MQYLLSMGAAVVSERSTTDPALDAEYADAVVFAGDPEAIRAAGQANANEFLKGQTHYTVLPNVSYVLLPQELDNFDSIIDAAFALARDADARRDLERRAWEKYQQSARDTDQLTEAIGAVLADMEAAGRRKVRDRRL